MSKPTIVCLCGSSRFINHFAVMQWELEKLGAIVLGLHLLPASYPGPADHIAEAEGVAKQMDELHLRKIDLADKITVINVDGYIGDSTKREIEYARLHGKPVSWLYTFVCGRCGDNNMHVLEDGLCPNCVRQLTNPEAI